MKEGGKVISTTKTLNSNITFKGLKFSFKWKRNYSLESFSVFPDF